MKLWTAARVQVVRLPTSPTHREGTDHGLSARPDVNPYGLRWMRGSMGRSELVVWLVFMVVGVLGSGGQRDGNDNWSL